jgi:alcohol dehydrogenase (cytochrome c)
VWEFQLGSGPSIEQARGGVLSTAGNLVFAGNGEGLFVGLDGRTGREVWRTNLGEAIYSSPITFTSEGTQLITVASGSNLFTFAARGTATRRDRPSRTMTRRAGTCSAPACRQAISPG